MSSNTVLFLVRTLGFSALAGMRSLSPPAILSLYVRQHQSLHKTIAQPLDSTVVRSVLMLLATGEMLADKVPQAPDRIFAPAVVVRAFTGGGASALLWSLHKRPAWLGGILGASTAIATTYATFNLRLWLGRTLPIPHALSWSGLLEDMVVWFGGWLLLSTDKKLTEKQQ